ncbi:N-terminal acetyltransferase complex subunit ARD1, putative [Eimeria acervulina]|uniref:N-terminal acetyltransferase complex subunit ARD1, putative n=1 Tax=Eimeria acervulina TaxID=5801 RepID=U6GX59_EIMAC|nr:N-terminal acetyltransferase complex subunit ARD1, putative [Eimeria acervulina]CDI84177.1 N-terminal acetyltransferase complex subunit ARD1, putative [Eimeria acervulina]
MCSLVRHSDVFDLFEMQHVNFVNLPENYVMKYYFFHALSWPQLPTVAEDSQGKIVGYVLAKLEDENQQGQKPHGHVTSVAVLRQNRKLGLASKLMTLSQRAMQDVFSAEFAALHVRVTNRAAFALYSKTLGYRVHDIDKEYYADKEDAFNMRNYFNKDKVGKGRRKEAEKETEEAAAGGASETSAAAAEQTPAAAATAAAAKGTAAAAAPEQQAAAAAQQSTSTTAGAGSSGSKNRRKKR